MTTIRVKGVLYILNDVGDVLYLLDKTLGYDATKSLEPFIADTSLESRIKELEDELESLRDDYDSACFEIGSANREAEEYEHDLYTVNQLIDSVVEDPIPIYDRDVFYQKLSDFSNGLASPDDVIDEFAEYFKGRLDFDA